MAQPASTRRAARGRTLRVAPEPEPLPESRRRVVIENVAPEVEGGRFPAKGTLGESILGVQHQSIDPAFETSATEWQSAMNP